MKIRKILVPTDLSPEGERAFPAVAELALQSHAAVLLLHVVENPSLSSAGAGPFPLHMLPGTVQEVQRVQELLEQRRGSFPKGVEVSVEALVAPSVPQAIAHHAQRNDCDLIALSSHGRSGFRRLVLGSVAEAVLRHSPVPVLVFPRQE